MTSGQGAIDTRLRLVLTVYSAGGLVLLIAALATFAVPSGFASALPIAEPWSTVAALALWIGTALLSYNLGSFSDRGLVVTAGDAAIIACAAVGGPAVAAIVAALGVTEVRELRRVPWYGVAANHGGAVIAWVVGSSVMVLLSSSSEGRLVAPLLGAAVALAVEAILAAGLYAARTGERIVDLLRTDFFGGYAVSAVSSVSLGLLAAAAYATIGLWSPPLLAAAAIAISRALAWQRDGWLLRHHQLTGLPNALALRQRAVQFRAVDRSRLAVLYLDLDGFKAVNDERDHSVGDDVLRVVGQRLSAACRPGDFLAHLHGDEFVVIATGVAAEDDVVALGARLVAAVEPVIDHPSGPISVSATVGHRLVTDREQLEAAIRDADRAMSIAKAAKGRRRIA